MHPSLAFASRPRPRALRLWAVAACVCALATPAATHAAPVTLEFSPAIIRMDADSGDQVRETFTISADSQPRQMQFVHAVFGFTGEDYRVTLITDDAPETTAFSTRGWFSLKDETFRVPAGVTSTLELIVDVPENTPAGTYLGAALIRVLPPKSPAGGSQLQIPVQGGPLVFIAVDGGKPPQAKIRRFDVPDVVRNGPIRPAITIANTGDEYFSFAGSIKLTGPGKDDSAKIARQYVVPGQPRTVRISADDKGAKGAVKLGDDSLAPGRHEVEVRLRIEPSGKTVVARRTIWIIPLWMRVLAGVLVLLTIAAVIGLARRRKRRRMIAATTPRSATSTSPDSDVNDHDEHSHDDVDAEGASEFEDDDFDSLDAEDDDFVDDLGGDEDSASAEAIGGPTGIGEPGTHDGELPPPPLS